MQRILVTGGCGFIGSHLIRRLLQQHPSTEIVNLDSYDLATLSVALRTIRTLLRG